MKKDGKKKKSKKKRVLIPVLCILLACCIAAAGYLVNMLGYFNMGSSSKYSASKCETKYSPLAGKTIVFLGSSVTYGFASKGESFADYLAARDGITAVKEAKSGTTLVDSGPSSYVSRMKTIDPYLKADAFVCQLSTNDATQKKPLGKISEGFDVNSFDTGTVAGAAEYIIAYATATWGCPVIFYTSPKYGSADYAKMVELLDGLKQKWGIRVIDMWNDDAFNSISDEQRKIYMNDPVHPTRLGYRDWWLPVFEEELGKVFTNKT